MIAIDSLRTSPKITLLSISIVVAGLVTTWFSLSQAFPGTFLLDDRGRILPPDINGIDFFAIGRAILEANSGPLGRPLSLFSLYLTKGMQGETPSAFIYHDILLHLATALLVFWFSGALLHTPHLGEKVPRDMRWPIAAVIGVAWAIHPIQVSTVVYAVQRMTQLSAFFTFLSLILYTKARLVPDPPRWRTISLLFGTVLFGICALLSKENAVLLPIYFLVIEIFAFRFHSTYRVSAASTKAIVATFTIVPITLGALYVVTHLPTLLHDYVMRPFTLSERLATEAWILWKYVGLVLLPRLSNMSLFHDATSILQPTSWTALLAIAAWLLAIATAIVVRNRAPLVTFGITFYMAGHLLESTIFPLELMFEHRNYIAMLGLLLALVPPAIGLYNSRTRVRLPSAVGAILLIGLLSFLQATRAHTWHNDAILYKLTSDEHPSSIRAASNIANDMLREGHLGLARAVQRRVIEASDRDVDPGVYLHLVLSHCYSKTIPDRLVKEVQERLKSAPLGPYTMSGLKALQRRLHRDQCPGLSAPMLADFNQLAIENPNTRLHHQFLTRNLQAQLLLAAGQRERARFYLEDALNHATGVPRHSMSQTYLVLAELCAMMEDESCARAAAMHARRLIDGALFPSLLAPESERLAALEKQLAKPTDSASPETTELSSRTSSN